MRLTDNGFHIITKRPLLDGTDGYRFKGLFTKGLVRKRKHKLRYGVTSGDTFTGYHLGKRSIYLQRLRPKRKLYNL